MQGVLNSNSQRTHSAGAERGTATPKESMTLNVQVNISKATKFTIACRLPCSSSPLNALNHTLNEGDVGRFQCRALVDGGLFFSSV